MTKHQLEGLVGEFELVVEREFVSKVFIAALALGFSPTYNRNDHGIAQFVVRNTASGRVTNYVRHKNGNVYRQVKE